VGAARIDHESDPEETDEETAGEEPLCAPEVELEEAGADGTEGEGEGLGVGEVAMVDSRLGSGPTLRDNGHSTSPRSPFPFPFIFSLFSSPSCHVHSLFTPCSSVNITALRALSSMLLKKPQHRAQ
jgi:hypothetical protein